MPLAILALHIPPLYIVQTERLTERGERQRNRRGEGEDDNTMDTVGNVQKGDPGVGDEVVGGKTVLAVLSG